jgi:hypothetical protein
MAPDSPRWQEWMDNPGFWAIVELGSPEAIRPRLAAMSEPELGAFYWTAHDFVLAFSEEEFAEAMEFPSEDGQFDDAAWIVKQGKAVFADYLAHPEKFNTVPADQGWDLLVLIGETFDARFDTDIYDYEPQD